MNYEYAYEQGRSFSVFLEEANANHELWQATARRAPVREEAVERIKEVGGTWKLLVLADDWCGDAVNTLPVMARLAESAPNLDLRVVGREEFPEIMDRHLTREARAIPVAILLDEKGEEQGWWGPRPRALQAWFDAEGRAMEKAERYKEIRRWYARDRGVSTAREIAELVVCGSRSGGVYRGTRPCKEALAA